MSTHKALYSLGSDWTFERVRKKLEAGEKLSRVEVEYLEGEAKAAAERVLTQEKSRGSAFQMLVASQVSKIAEQNFRRDNPTPPPTFTSVSWLDDEGNT